MRATAESGESAGTRAEAGHSPASAGMALFGLSSMAFTANRLRAAAARCSLCVTVSSLTLQYRGCCFSDGRVLQGYQHVAALYPARRIFKRRMRITAGVVQKRADVAPACCEQTDESAVGLLRMRDLPHTLGERRSPYIGRSQSVCP
jgi:hypothetical protein